MRDLERLSSVMRKRVGEAVHQFAATESGDVKRLRGYTGVYRLRVGEWRVRFQFTTDHTGINIVRVLPRGRAYR